MGNLQECCSQFCLDEYQTRRIWLEKSSGKIYVSECLLNRRMRLRMSGGVRGGEGNDPAYSILVLMFIDIAAIF